MLTTYRIQLKRVRSGIKKVIFLFQRYIRRSTGFLPQGCNLTFGAEMGTYTGADVSRWGVHVLSFVPYLSGSQVGIFMHRNRL